MCTVSFVRVKEDLIITSSRDEKTSRKTAVLPQVYSYKEQKLFFPKDSNAGGTWIVIKENGDAAVLLNGAATPHVYEPPYRLSRGIVLLDIIAEEKPSAAFMDTDLQGIEPFTLVLVENNCLYESRWDGRERSCKQLNIHKSHIWSSVTLYHEFDRMQREQWFTGFLNSYPLPTQEDILNFHRAGGNGNMFNDRLLIRGETYKTVSITSLLLTKEHGHIKYLDLQTGAISDTGIALQYPAAAIK